MNFASIDYGIFLLFVYVGYRFFWQKSKTKHLWLLLSSLFFYGVGSGWHIALLIYSGLCDYGISIRLFALKEKPSQRKAWLTLSILNNLGLLFAFKYLDAVISFVNGFLSNMPWAEFQVNEIPTTGWLLPIGISFYTFQTMSYSLDVYYGRLKPCRDLREYLLYVTFFPQLVAGPILRAQQFIPQLSKKFVFDSDMFFKGVFFILLGLVKKVYIADSLGILWVDPVYGSVSQYGWIDISLATYAYAFQIYNDFSGYSDIAIGSALLLGFIVPINFDRPFSCTNPADFWNRWHISLSHWVRDYLFYPMMMKGPLKGKIMINLFLTTVIIGIWHGASFTFLLFGLWHAMLAVLHRWAKPKWLTLSWTQWKCWPFLCWFIYFHLVCIGMVMFRANSLTHLTELLSKFSHTDAMPYKFDLPLWCMFALFFAVLTHLPRAHHWESIAQFFNRRHLLWQLGLTWCCLCLFFACSQMFQGQAAFIYFRF